MAWNDRGNGYRNPQGQYKKRSGAKYAQINNGKMAGAKCIVGWNYSQKRGMVAVSAFPFKGMDTGTTQNGRTWEKWLVKLSFRDTLREETYSGFYSPNEDKLRIPDIGWTVSPRAANGGFCGPVDYGRK